MFLSKFNLYKRFFIITFYFLQYITLNAQNNQYGISLSNYAGIRSLKLNPANIADSRFGFELTLLGSNSTIDVNQNILTSFNILDISNKLKNTSLTNVLLGNNNLINQKDKYLGFNTNIDFDILGVSFNFNKHRAIALNISSRTLINFGGIDYKGMIEPYQKADAYVSDTIKLRVVDDGNVTINPFNTKFNMGQFYGVITSFIDIGLSYAQTVYNKEKHFVKVGGTFKTFLGLGVMNFSSQDINADINLKLPNANIQSSGSVVASAGVASVFKNSSLFSSSAKSSSFMPIGFGLDIGGVYEYRPNYTDFQYEADGKILEDLSKNKYQFKAGFSIVDFGSITFKNGVSYSGNFATNKTMSFDSLKKLDVKNPKALNDQLNLKTNQDSNATLKVHLPTTLNFFFDYHIWKWFYAGAMASINVSKTTDAYNIGLKTPSHFVISPRFESRYLEIGIPLIYNTMYSNIKMGLGVRLGFFYFGSDDIFLRNGVNAYVGFRMNIQKKKPKSKTPVAATQAPETLSLPNNPKASPLNLSTPNNAPKTLSPIILPNQINNNKIDTINKKSLIDDKYQPKIDTTKSKLSPSKLGL